jgi:Ca-activated chloride channel family protein
MDLSALRAFHFLHPAWLLALPLLWALAAWLAFRARRDSGWSGVIDAELLPALRLSKSGSAQSPWWLLAAVWTLAALALAGMTWQRVESMGFRAPTDWILVLDLSPSMAATDVPPNRVARAHYLVSDLLNAARDTRVALVAFGGDAHTVAPLTTDVATIRALLPPLDPSIMPEAGDALGPALDEAARLMSTVASRRPQIVVLTDGVADPAEALSAARRLRDRGATIDVIGIGTTNGAPEPDGQGTFVQDAGGRSLLSKLPVDQLERLAAAGGGRYVSFKDADSLIAELSRRTPASDVETPAGPAVSMWRNAGIWLLPPLVLLVSLFARRGWL